MVDEKLTNIDDNLALKWAMTRRDRKALASLHAKYYPRIKYYIASRLVSTADTEDLAQDVFTELCKSNGQHDRIGDPEQYIFGIARNLIRQFYRKRAKSIKTIPIEEIGSVPAEPAIASTPKTTISEIIAQLSPTSRQAIKLRFIDGLSPAEAAKIARCPVEVFYQRVYKGLKTLKATKDMGRSNFEVNKIRKNS